MTSEPPARLGGYVERAAVSSTSLDPPGPHPQRSLQPLAPALLSGTAACVAVCWVYTVHGFPPGFAWVAALTCAVLAGGLFFMLRRRTHSAHSHRRQQRPRHPSFRGSHALSHAILALIMLSATFSSCALDAQGRLNAQAFISDAPLQARLEVTEAPRDIGPSMLTHVSVTPLVQAGLSLKEESKPRQNTPRFEAVIFTPSSQIPENAAVGTQWTAWIRVKAHRERASEPVSVAVLSPPVDEASAPAGFSAWVRANLQKLGQRWGGEAGALIPGLIVGDRSSQSVEQSASMVVSGLSHLTAVSGANVAAMVLIVTSLCRLVRLRGIARYAVILAVIITFAHIVGPDPSVLRACIMGAVGAFAVTVGRPAAAIALLALAATVLLLLDPWMLVAPAFQLSVLATFGILIGSHPLAQLLQGLKFPRLFAEVTAVSAAATIACTPVLVAMDPAQSLWVVPINVLASPAAALVGLAAPSVMLLGWIPWPWGWPLAACVGLPAHVITMLAGFSAEHAPMHHWPEMPWGFLLAAITCWVLPATLLVLAQRARPDVLRAWLSHVRLGLQARRSASTIAAAPSPYTGHRQPGVGHSQRGFKQGPPKFGQRPAAILLSASVIVSFVFVLASFIRAPDPALSRAQAGDILFCDVGQGDALAVIGDENNALLIDAGPDPTHIDACLSRAGITKLCGVVITHLDLDHVGGLDGALNTRELSGEVIYGTAKRRPPVEQARRALEGEQMTCGPWSVDVLWAPQQASSENGASVVTRARMIHGDGLGVELINTGDLESEQAQLMLRSHKLERSTGDLRVLKVAHHGSATGGTELIEEFQPDLALIGVGADNDYGHPRQVILEALYRANVSVHRTDQEGTIIVRPVSGTEEADNRVGAQVLHERSPAGSIR